MPIKIRTLIVVSIISIILCCIFLVSCGNSVNTNSTQKNGHDESTNSNSEPFSETEDSKQSRINNIPEKEYEKPTIVVESKSAEVGETITVSINVYNNPGVAGALLCLHYSEGLNLRMVENGSAFAFLDYTGPGSLEDFCRFSWDSERGMATQNGVMLTLTFTIDSTVKSGEKLTVSCSYRTGDIYDENLDDVEFEMLPGCILVTD